MHTETSPFLFETPFFYVVIFLPLQLHCSQIFELPSRFCSQKYVCDTRLQVIQAGNCYGKQPERPLPGCYQGGFVWRKKSFWAVASTKILGWFLCPNDMPLIKCHAITTSQGHVGGVPQAHLVSYNFLIPPPQHNSPLSHWWCHVLFNECK